MQLFTLKLTTGTSKIIMGPAVRYVLPHDVAIVKPTCVARGQLNLVNVCGIGNFEKLTDCCIIINRAF
jgi:hypothetical protein